MERPTSGRLSTTKSAPSPLPNQACHQAPFSETTLRQQRFKLQTSWDTKTYAAATSRQPFAAWNCRQQQKSYRLLLNHWRVVDGSKKGLKAYKLTLSTFLIYGNWKKNAIKMRLESLKHNKLFYDFFFVLKDNGDEGDQRRHLISIMETIQIHLPL